MLKFWVSVTLILSCNILPLILWSEDHLKLSLKLWVLLTSILNSFFYNFYLCYISSIVTFVLFIKISEGLFLLTFKYFAVIYKIDPLKVNLHLSRFLNVFQDSNMYFSWDHFVYNVLCKIIYLKLFTHNKSKILTKDTCHKIFQVFTVF